MIESEGIFGFSGKNRFLSNFYPVDFIIDGVNYKSSEHYYMSCKTTDVIIRNKIINAKTPSIAKTLGRSCKLRPGWDEHYKDRAMMTGLVAKFNNPDMKAMLLLTGDAYLEETNHWGDVYWGVCDGVGENRLGKMLMFIRKKTRNELTI
jgi:ribA/ribD-fused uncharacterized protein